MVLPRRSRVTGWPQPRAPAAASTKALYPASFYPQGCAPRELSVEPDPPVAFSHGRPAGADESGPLGPRRLRGHRRAWATRWVAHPALVVGAGLIGTQVVRLLLDHPEYGHKLIAASGPLDADPDGRRGATSEAVMSLVRRGERRRCGSST